MATKPKRAKVCPLCEGVVGALIQDMMPPGCRPVCAECHPVVMAYMLVATTQAGTWPDAPMSLNGALNLYVAELDKRRMDSEHVLDYYTEGADEQGIYTETRSFYGRALP